jgi:DNA invertase Pin-like site-specific DNA recombinase
MRILSYFRVSTASQGASGLGLDAQKRAVNDLCKARNARVVASFKEVETGKRDDRPELAKAMHLAKVTGATLCIAKLDRLSRNAAFLLNLRDSGVKFICADMPDANDLTIGILALVAQQEREAISKRTKDALREARERGTRLGNPNGADALRRAAKGNTAAIQVVREKASKRANDLRDIVADIKANGINTLHGIADELNAREMLTPRGAQWHPTSVGRLLERIAA